MSQISANLGLPFLQPAQAQKHVTHNEALRQLDIAVQLRLQTTGATTAPTAPEEGDVHALGPGATGSWAGQDGTLAVWRDDSWHFVAPRIGWRGWDVAAAALVVWDGNAWTTPFSALDMLQHVGIGTAANAENRLAVAAPASLLSHVGNDHRLKVNKAAAADTASLLFQSDWTGHAEMGLTGQTAFSIKVSPDGANWTEALRLDDATGLATGSAVQADAADAGAGRLLTSGAFGLGQTGAGPDISDIDATDTPAGLWRFGTGTANAASLPATLGNSDGQIRIERFDADTLRQSAWRSDFSEGTWIRVCVTGIWGSWRQILDHDTLLGPVSQSGGLPTGAVFEHGTNADGSYLRLADGTQICSHVFDSAATTHVWTFPAAFAAADTVVLQALPRHATAPRIVTENEDLSPTGVTFNVWDATGTAAGAKVFATATGRWV